MSDFIPKIKENLENYEKGIISIYYFHEKLYEIFVEMDKNLSFSVKIKKLLKNENIFIQECMSIYTENEKDNIHNVLSNLIFYEKNRPQQVAINLENINRDQKECIDKILKKINFLPIENSNLYNWKI